MQINLVDPRDQNLEIDRPTYRVHFWTANQTSEEYEIRDAASVVEVLQWADAEAASRSHGVYLCLPSPDGVTLARLRGDEPTTG